MDIGENFRLLFENLIDASAFYKMIYDDEGRPVDFSFLEINRVFEKVTGLNRDDVIGKRMKEVFTNIDNSWMENFLKVATTGVPCRFEGYDEQHTKWLSINAFSPELGFLSLIVGDISERKNFEEQARQINDNLERLVSERTHQLYEMNILLEGMNAELEETNAELEESNALLQEQIVERQKAEEKVRILNRDLEKTVLKRTSELQDINVALEEEISERNRAERILIQSEEKYRLLVTQMKQGLALHEIILNEAGEPVDYRFIEVNESFERMTGLKREKVLGKTVLELLPETESYWIERYGHVAMTGESLRYENYSRELNRYYDVVAYSPRLHQFAVITTDITIRKKMEKMVSSEKERFKTTLLSVGDGVISTDREGNIEFINSAAEELTGWTQEEALERSLDEIFHVVNEYSRERCENPLTKIIDTGKTLDLADHNILISKMGLERYIEESASPIKDEDGIINGVVLVFRDFTDKKARLKEIEYLSFHDQLTGLYNRRFFEEELTRMDNPRNLPITLIMADVNGLKLTNDAFGHLVGDKLLEKIAEVLKKECRAIDIIARIGGDEFVILLPNANSKEASKIVERINKSIHNQTVESVILSVSFGWDTKNEASEKISDIFKKAEDYMYRRKLTESSSMRNKTIEVIANALFRNNERERLHSEKVSSFCHSIGIALDLSEDEINVLKMVGLMHDIGKIGIDERVLNKPGKLSRPEWIEVKRHSEKGFHILGSVNEFSHISNYVLAHHERWDGVGYPKGLLGDEIPLISRIISIADAYAAMICDRPYRKALSEDEAIKEIIENTGTQFDPDISKVFIEKVLGKMWN